MCLLIQGKLGMGVLTGCWKIRGYILLKGVGAGHRRQKRARKIQSVKSSLVGRLGGGGETEENLVLASREHDILQRGLELCF